MVTEQNERFVFSEVHDSIPANGTKTNAINAVTDFFLGRKRNKHATARACDAYSLRIIEFDIQKMRNFERQDGKIRSRIHERASDWKLFLFIAERDRQTRPVHQSGAALKFAIGKLH